MGMGSNDPVAAYLWVFGSLQCLKSLNKKPFRNNTKTEDFQSKELIDHWLTGKPCRSWKKFPALGEMTIFDKYSLVFKHNLSWKTPTNKTNKNMKFLILMRLKYTVFQKSTPLIWNHLTRGFSQIEVPNQMWWELSDVQLINVQPSKQQLVWRVEICLRISRP